MAIILKYFINGDRTNEFTEKLKTLEVFKQRRTEGVVTC